MYQIPCYAIQNQNPLSMQSINAPPFFSITNASSSSSVTFLTSMGFSATNSNLVFKTTSRFAFYSTRKRCGFASLVVRAKAGTDYYSTLNVSSKASLQEIKTSYRQLARKVPFFLMGFCICFVFWFIYVVILMGRVWFLRKLNKRRRTEIWGVWNLGL